MRDEESARKLNEAATLINGVMERLKNPIGLQDRMELMMALSEVRKDICAVFEVMRKPRKIE